MKIELSGFSGLFWGQDFGNFDDEEKVKRYVTLLDAGFVGAFMGLVAFFQVLPAGQNSQYSSLGDWKCSAAAGAESSSGPEFFESNDFAYPMKFHRVASSSHPENAKFWVLYGISPEQRNEVNLQLRGPASAGLSDDVYEPIAFMRDDNGDSHPDTAYLFQSKTAAPLKVSLEGEEWTSEKGCHFWRDPVVSFVRWSLAEHNWIPGHAYGHMWTSYLERLSEFDVSSFRGEGVDPELDKLKIRSSLLDGSTATQVFELVSASVADAGLEELDSEEEFWKKAPEMAFDLLDWTGFRVEQVRSSSKEIIVEGVKKPLKSRNYIAPALFVSEKEDGWNSAKLAVFDVLLFNSWTSKDAWQRRTTSK